MHVLALVKLQDSQTIPHEKYEPSLDLPPKELLRAQIQVLARYVVAPELLAKFLSTRWWSQRGLKR
jgi:hypothetical protein